MQTMDVSTIRDKAEGHWFDKDTMRFFGTRLTETAYSSDGEHWHFAYSNGNAPGGREYRVATWRKVKRGVFSSVYVMDKNNTERYSSIRAAGAAARRMAS
jgi:hypothetical protein